MSGELLSRLTAYPRMQQTLTSLPPKMLSLASGMPPQVIEQTGDLVARVDKVKASIRKATFTGKGDAETVPKMYEDYVARIADVLQKTLALAGAEASQLALPVMPSVSAPVAAPLRLADGQLLLQLSDAASRRAGDEGASQLRAWHVDCLRVQHASIPDALSGKQLDTLQDCVPIAITGKDAAGRPLVGVRDAASLAGWLQELSDGEGVLLTAEPAAGKTWLLSQV